MNEPHFTVYCLRCVVLSDFLESVTYLSQEKFKTNNERHKTEAFLNCELRSSFLKLAIY